MNKIIKQFAIIFSAFIMIVFTVYAQQSKDIIITNGMINSYERCPSKFTTELRCSTYYQTTNYTCGPAAVMTVMRYYGKLRPDQMNHQTEMLIANEMGATPGFGGGTTTSEMSDYLSSHGFSVKTGSDITTDMLISYINKGILVIVTYNNHWIVAKGYTLADKSISDDEDEIDFSDSCCGTSVISRSDIDNTWQESHMPHHECSVDGNYIIATPD